MSDDGLAGVDGVDAVVVRLVDISPIPTLIVTLDENHRILHMNRRFSEVFGYGPREVWDVESWWPRAYPEATYREQVKAAWRAAIGAAIEAQRSAIAPVEVRVSCRDGAVRDVEVHMGMIGGHAIVLFNDVTERKRTEQALLDAQGRMERAQRLESLSALAGGIAHDFNNLLTTMLGNASLIAPEVLPGSVAAEALDDLRTAIRRAAELTQQMLLYAGRAQLEKGTLSLDEIVRGTQTLLEATVSRRATLRFELAPATVRGSAVQIRQVVSNLVVNASEAVEPAGGLITIRSGVRALDPTERIVPVLPELPAGHYAFLEVEDTGVGMSDDTLRKIFDPFFSTKFAGRGLGLPAVLGITKSHGGGVSVRSTAGQGTRVTLFFPALRAAAETLAAALPASRAGPTRARGLVLVVDDEPMIRQVLKRALAEVGFETMLAANGREGLDLFEARRQDLSAIVLDLTMPVMDGWAVLEALDRLGVTLPVIVISGDASRPLPPGNAPERRHFMPKPFTSSELAARLRELVADLPDPAGERRPA